jgi:hypothetical protein
MFANVVGRREGRIVLCSLKRCIEDLQSAVGSPEEYPCLERVRARCKAENVIRLRNVIEVFARHYWLLQFGSVKKKTPFSSWRSNFESLDWWIRTGLLRQI